MLSFDVIKDDDYFIRPCIIGLYQLFPSQGDKITGTNQLDQLVLCHFISFFMCCSIWLGCCITYGTRSGIGLLPHLRRAGHEFPSGLRQESGPIKPFVHPALKFS